MRQLILNIAMITVSVLLTGCVLLQQRGSGLGVAFGGDSAVFRTKRGIEKVVFYFTVALSVLFFGISIVNLFV